MPGIRTSHVWGAVVALALLLVPCAPGAAQDAETPPATEGAASAPAVAGAPVSAGANRLSEADLDKLVGPIALYPDSLIAIVLAAASYPLEVVQAARWAKKHGGGDPDNVPDADWDANVKELVKFPTALEYLDKNLDWTMRLGDAVAAQQADVMDAIQRFRVKAQAAGNLESNDKVTVVEERTVIKIVPAQPQVIYVPVYEPTRVIYAQPYPYTYSSGITFYWSSYSCDWWHHDVYHDHDHDHHDGNKNKNKNKGNDGGGNKKPGGTNRPWKPDPDRRPAGKPGSRPGNRPGTRPGAGTKPGRPAGRPSLTRPGGSTHRTLRNSGRGASSRNRAGRPGTTRGPTTRQAPRGRPGQTMGPRARTGGTRGSYGGRGGYGRSGGRNRSTQSRSRSSGWSRPRSSSRARSSSSRGSRSRGGRRSGGGRRGGGRRR